MQVTPTNSGMLTRTDQATEGASTESIPAVTKKAIKTKQQRIRSYLAFVCLVMLQNLIGAALSSAYASPGSWSNTGPMIEGRTNHTATRLLNGKVLLTGPFSAAELFDPTTGSFTATGSTSVDRYNPTATLLRNGKVLITGGTTSGASITTHASAEIYDPNTGSFTSLSSTMQSPRAFHTATLLPNGKVLIAGGLDSSHTYLSSAELFDPSTNSFTPLNHQMLDARAEHTATLMQDGNVLLAGGATLNGEVLYQAEIFDPSTGDFYYIPSGGLIDARMDHTATLLSNGQVLFTGGQGATFDYLSTAELYDPSSGRTARVVGSMAAARTSHTATLLPNGKVLISGGYNSANELSSSELFDIASSTFTATGSMNRIRAWHTATLLEDGRVLVAGGYDLKAVAPNSPVISSAELYCPDSGVILPSGSLAAARSGHTATALPNGTVLIAGGFDFNHNAYLNTAELYNPTTKSYTPINSLLPRARAYHTATLLPDGKVLLVGGMNRNFSALASADIFDPATNTFSFAGLAMVPRINHTATLMPNGSVMIIGGDGYNQTNSAERFINGHFENVAWLKAKRNGHAATLLADGNVLITGGSDSLQAELLDSFGNSTLIGAMKEKRSRHTATLLPDGSVLIAGGQTFAYDSPSSESAEIYNPANSSFAYTGNLGGSRSEHTATLLPNGQVLLIGGEKKYYDKLSLLETMLLDSAELYDPGQKRFNYAGTMAFTRSGHTATFLENCMVLIAGGDGLAFPQLGNSPLASSELYKPTVCGPAMCGPAIQSISPTGTAAAITGLNFGTSQGNSRVSFNGIDAGTATSWSDTSITINVPNGITTASVIVTVNGFPSNAMPFSGACAANITSRVSAAYSGFRYNRTTHRYVQQVTLTNIGNTAIAGSVALALDNLSANATLFNKSGTTACATPASPYIAVDVGADGVMSVGEQSTVLLDFVNSANASITYSSRILNGANK